MPGYYAPAPRPVCRLVGCGADVPRIRTGIAGGTYCTDRHFALGVQRRHQNARSAAALRASGVDPLDEYRERRAAVSRRAGRALAAIRARSAA